MNRSPAKKTTKGTFMNGIWYCECVPRLPAEHFQTKNGGQNHGRWCTDPLIPSIRILQLILASSVYTCQKSQPKRCKFFLWDDDAKAREEAAVLTKSRSETEPQTPPKPMQPTGQHTPPHLSLARHSHEGVATLSSECKTLPGTNSEKDFGWSASNDKALVEADQKSAMAPPETPRKTPRTSQLTSPGKRKDSEMLEIDSDFSTPLSSDNVFNTPLSSLIGKGLLSPVDTPGREKLQGRISPLAEYNLAVDALRILERYKLPAEVEQKLIELFNKHELRTQGIIKGRDITRLALSSKERKIAELEARIASLEAERETS